MYILYLPKYKRERCDNYLIIKAIGEYMRCTEYKYDIISSPGYLSKTADTIEMFLDNFNRTLFGENEDEYDNKEIYWGIFNGMNGANRCQNGNRKASPDAPTIKQYHYEHICNSTNGNIRWMPIVCSEDIDHRKMMFFIEIKNQELRDREINKDTYVDFLDQVTVHAVLIGSSNQSYSTYYKSNQQGEADILLFDEKNKFHEYISGGKSKFDLKDKIILTKSFYPDDLKDGEYLKDILRDLFKNSLK